MENEIVNKVANSGLIQLDLEDLRPIGERVFFDIKPLLYQELVLKEKDFRTFLAEHDWSYYQGKYVAIGCSADAIIPTWAFMLLSIHLTPYAKRIVEGNLQDLENELYREVIDTLNLEEYKEARIVIKGCSKESVPLSAYIYLSTKLQPIAKSLFFGEPCSTVPLFKKK
ncbi:MAG: hypothetical protein RJA76_1327 [Bacteroidota bacterium]|jgi:hypothetical protein